MKKKILFVVLIVMVFGIVAWGKTNETKKTNEEATNVISTNEDGEKLSATNSKEKPKEIIMSIDTDADMDKSFDNIDELQDNCDLIIKGVVEAIKPYCDETATVYSNYSVKISESFKGDLKEGDTLTISDFGGIIPAEEYLKYQDDPKAVEEFQKYETLKDKYVEYSFEGAWRPETGKTYIWYLEKNKVGDKTYYNPANAYQGIFKVKGNELERYNPEVSDKNYQTKCTMDEIK
ncbi:hypothetical protein SAMN05216249_10628 [Acetitomaculum ruminis DSM 5522]|uniref:Uncharacterized protein n=1 Tax=Acetitomaculum ruminis DSM 5522 TaxID=1120918 RepID=A0A1I0X8T6_9FIRM|nr:hypothetical protein [Acetitomaculum ruminis]SFA97435.1 hypothetical protein SAMN05216249_10628 [Acetitomaculum ruminis DSM 5522]